MVSLLSFFTGKKKSRRAPSPPVASALTSAPRNANDPPAAPRRAGGRFLSLRHKPTPGRPADIASRRASSDITRKKSTRRVSKEELPKLALGWELGETNGDILGLQGVGRPPKLSIAERKVLDEVRWSLDEVAKGWQRFGEALMSVGLDTPGIFMPRKLSYDEDERQLLLALFALSLNPALTTSFPSLTSHYMSHSSTGSVDDSKAWNDRLRASLANGAHPVVLAECLKFISRRRKLGLSDSDDGALGNGLYSSFLRAEQLADFPLDSYDKVFVPRITPGVKAYLEDVFQVWAAVAAHANANELQGGKLSHLLGWWIWGQKAREGDWRTLYNDWVGAGRRVEHLFYAWIRCQSMKQSLPTRLLQLVEKYPYGEVQPGHDFLPTPPSSFGRKTLRLTLASQEPLSKGLTPYGILQAALHAAAAAEAAPTWTDLQSAPTAEQMQSLLDDESASFVASFEDARDDGVNGHAKAEGAETPAIVDEQPIYRPFANTLEAQHARRRSKSSSDLLLSVPALGPIDVSGSSSLSPHEGLSPSRLAKQQSTGTLRPLPKTADTWDNFMSTGFAEGEKDKLELSPSPAPAVLRPSPSSRVVSFGSDVSQRPGDAPNGSRSKDKYAVSDEEIVDIDDLFIAFVQDGQLDKTVRASWPTFALFRLRAPIARADGAIECLLITLEYRPPARSPSPVLDPIERSASPAESTASRSLNFFRRSSSFGPRRSLFGSKVGAKTSASAYHLPTLAEGGASKTVSKEPVSAISAAPTEYTITEMGEMVMIPSDKAPTAMSSDSPMSATGVLDPTHDSKACDWAYRAEGGVHMIFEYRGSSSAYTGRVLRLRKPTSPLNAHHEVATHWRENLLPKLLSADLLLSSTPVRLDHSWARDLLEKAEKVRPESRKVDSGDQAAALDGDVTASIMDDTTAAGADMGTVFAVEIKPKWGFLPSASSVTPPQAAAIKSQHSRYVLHRHYKRAGLDDTYDPLDLFADDRTRVGKALESLWAIWTDTAGAKNNWRVYMDGKPIRPNQTDRLPGSPKVSLVERTAPFLVPALQSSKVLPKLRDLQSTLDPVDISTLAQRFRAEHPNHELFDPSIAFEPTIAELDAFVEKYHANPSAYDTWTLREQMIAYALSAIFKDCSIFVTIPLAKDGDSWAVQTGAKVKTIDLDLKDVSGLKKWYDVDEAIWRHWLDTHPAYDVDDGDTEDHEPAASDVASGSKPILLLSPTDPDMMDTSSTRAMFAPSLVPSGPGTPIQLSTQGGSLDITPQQEASGPSSFAAVSRAGDSPTGATSELTQGVAAGISSSDVSDEAPPIASRSQDGTETALLRMTDGTPDDSHCENTKLDGNGTMSQGLPMPPARSDTPIAERTKRSLAPSPSPIPADTDQSREAGSIPDITTQDAHAQSSVRPDVGDGHTVTQVDFAPAGSGAVDENPETVESLVKGSPCVPTRPLPKAVEMLRDDSGTTEQTAGTIPSGTSTPLEEFLTPAAEVPEPVLASVGMTSPDVPSDPIPETEEANGDISVESEDDEDDAPAEADNTFGQGQTIPGRIDPHTASAADNVVIGAPIASALAATATSAPAPSAASTAAPVSEAQGLPFDAPTAGDDEDPDPARAAEEGQAGADTTGKPIPHGPDFESAGPGHEGPGEVVQIDTTSSSRDEEERPLNMSVVDATERDETMSSQPLTETIDRGSAGEGNGERQSGDPDLGSSRDADSVLPTAPLGHLAESEPSKYSQSSAVSTRDGSIYADGQDKEAVNATAMSMRTGDSDGPREEIAALSSTSAVGGPVIKPEDVSGSHVD